MKLSKSNSIIKLMNSTFIDSPSPSTITFNWNFGSLLGITLVMQIITGLMMTFHYTPDINLAFSSLTNSFLAPKSSWLIRWTHANGASLIFFLMYFHIGRNMYYLSYKKMETWVSGMTLFLLMMATAFLGYVLPWGQMSLWGVTVITNLLSAIPYIGPDIVTWLWGGFSVNNPTLKRFYSLHFLLPFIILVFVFLHLMFLHQQGSTNPLHTQNINDTMYFHPYFITKDLMGLALLYLLFFMLILHNPLYLNDPENFILANPMITPIHIQPEWYFLFAYAILRSIPNKIGGVMALLFSIIIFYLPPFISYNKIPTKFSPIKKFGFWMFITTFLILTWIGTNPVEDPYIMIGAFFSLLYFILFILIYLK